MAIPLHQLINKKGASSRPLTTVLLTFISTYVKLQPVPEFKEKKDMTSTLVSRGSLPEIIRNSENLYAGDLIAYFRVIFNYAQNLQHPYHNFRHMFHVLWLCYQACVFYANRFPNALTRREMRDLLIAALFHDFDHSGMMGNDDLNIARALRGFQKHIATEDLAYVGYIGSLIEATEYPYRIPSRDLPLRAQIIRDADLSQALSPAWIQQVVFGLAAEWGKRPIEVLMAQGAFHRGPKFHTKWAQEMFPEDEITRKIEEAEELLGLLEAKPATTA